MMIYWLRSLVFIVLGVFVLPTFASHNVDLYIFNEVEGEMVYPQTDLVRTQGCLLAKRTIGPTPQHWQSLSYLNVFEFSDPFSIRSASLMSHPGLENCMWVVEATLYFEELEQWYVNFDFFWDNGLYCIRNRSEENSIRAYLSVTPSSLEPQGLVIHFTESRGPNQTCVAHK